MIMSEELGQRYPSGTGRKIGRFELFETQLTTISQYADYGLLPRIDYGKYKNRKPDALIIDRIPDVHPVAVAEYKDIGEISDSNWESLAYDLVTTKSRPINSPIAFLADGARTYWLNGLSEKVELIRWEDTERSINKIDFEDAAFISRFEYLVSYFDAPTSIVKSRQNTNPHKLADEM